MQKKKWDLHTVNNRFSLSISMNFRIYRHIDYFIFVFELSMQYTLEPGQQSNRGITLTVTPDDMAAHKQKALANFQKEMKEPGFRDGQVPLDIVEKKVNPAYVEMAILEEVVHAGTKQIIEEHEDKKFIGTIYNLDRKEENEQTLITFFLDVYPEVSTKNDKWQSLTIDKIDDTPTPEEIDETLTNLRKQYADYKACDAITPACVFKVKFVLKDDAGEEVDTGSVYLGSEELTEFPILTDMFIGKKNDDVYEWPYDAEKLPPMLHSRNKDGKTPTTLHCTISDIREITLPDFSPENIKKFFGNDDVTTEMLLMQSVDGLLTKATSSFDLTIPKTLIDEEMKTRMKSLEERMGGEEGMKQYLEKIGKEDSEKMMTEIQWAAKQSLEKFFLLQAIVKHLWIENPDRKTPMDVEQKLYDKLAK